MINIEDLIIILTLHFVGDYVFQTRWMGNNKSSSNFALLSHVGVYTLVLMMLNPLWGIINGVLHGFIDYGTSRICKYLWNKKEEWAFFVVLGLDQVLHLIILFITYEYIVNV